MSPSDADLVLVKLDAVKNELGREMKDLKADVAELKQATDTHGTWIARFQGAISLLAFLIASGLFALIVNLLNHS